MQILEGLPTTDSFRVEVSGWDQDEIYFVEKSNLDWDEFAGKHISLKHMLPEGAMVFIRVLQPTAMRQSPPVPYQAEFIGCDSRRNQYEQGHQHYSQYRSHTHLSPRLLFNAPRSKAGIW